MSIVDWINVFLSTGTFFFLLGGFRLEIKGGYLIFFVVM